ncbi:MAG TPA: Fic family protein [Thermoanaerobaculia bacterium]|nr:Fic family protein [Thermoanaerobaculia bacterium]
MDRSKFTSSASGHLVGVTIGGPDWSFIPQPLPRTWAIPLKLWPLLASAKEELARLDGIGRILPRPELLLRPLQSREAIRSSSLEGTYASAEELLLFELDQQDRSGPADRVNDWQEVFNYAEAVRLGTELLTTLPLSLRLIREMHAKLLTGVRGRDRAPGEFRRNEVHIGSDRRYVPPPANELLPRLDDFEKFLNEAEGIDPLVRTYIAHYQFEAIHPFVDGNGRVGRALLSLCAYKWCGLSRPWLYVSPYFDRHKDEYIDRLFAVSATAAWEPWLELCFRATIAVCRDAVRRCEQLAKLREEYHAKADRASGRMHALIEQLFTNPFVRVTEVRHRLGVTYPTANSDIAKLVELGILEKLDRAYPKAFFSPAIFDAAYREDDAPVA